MNICPKCGSRETLIRGVKYFDGPANGWEKPEHGFIVSLSCYGCFRDFNVTVWQDVNRVRTEME